jgi:hypothetical protein
MQNQMWSYFSIFIVGLLVLGSLVVLILFGNQRHDEYVLPLVAIVGVTALLLLLALVSVSFAAANLSDRTQALGLPEGSVQSVIAISLVVLFVILSIFLYDDLAGSTETEVKSISDLTKENASKFESRYPKDLMLATAGPNEKDRYTVYYRLPPPDQATEHAKEDFAKQLLVLIGTLVTAVASFYFGSRATAAARGPGGKSSENAPARNADRGTTRAGQRSPQTTSRR